MYQNHQGNKRVLIVVGLGTIISLQLYRLTFFKTKDK